MKRIEQKNGTEKFAGSLDVLSCGVYFSLDDNAKECIAQADIIFGSRTLLEQCQKIQNDFVCQEKQEYRIIAAAARKDAQDALEFARAGKRVVALSTGDALYHGFGSTLNKLANSADIITFHPHITAFQALFHRLGLAWSDAKLFSAHAGNYLPLRSFVDSPLGVIYAGTNFPAHIIARAVIEMQESMKNRAAVITEYLGAEPINAENLGAESDTEKLEAGKSKLVKSEKIVSGKLEDLAKMEFSPTSILILLPFDFSRLPQKETLERVAEKLPEKNIFIPRLPEFSFCDPYQFTDAPILSLGLPNDFYAKENNLITAADVRAIALSRLQLPAWGTMWDIGAGSGSVGLEAAALRPHLCVYGVEQNKERLSLIETNRKSLGVPNYFIHHAEASTLIDTDVLPSPDRIFIGGGGAKLPQLLEVCLKRLKAHGIIIVSVITIEAIQALFAFKPELRHGVSRLDIANEEKIAKQYHHLKPQNTIYLFTFKNEAK